MKKSFLDEKLHKMTLGQKIRKKRRALGWTQAQLGREVGITQKQISKIESDKIKRLPEEALIHKFAEALKESVSYLHGEIPKASTQNRYKVTLKVNQIGEETMAEFYGKGKDVTLKSEKGGPEIKAKVIECTKNL